MFPVAFEIYGFPIHTYGIFMALGFAAALFVAISLGKQSNIKPEDIGDVCLVALLTGLIGGRLLFVAVEWDQFKDELSSIIFRRDGFVFFGGLVFSTLATYLFIKYKKLELGKLADILAPALALGHSIGRLGCFSQGCCYGKPFEYGLLFPESAPASIHFHGVPVHPTQLYESLALLIIFGILMKARKSSRFDGSIFLIYLSLYSIFRFFNEFLRADDRGFYFYGISVSQLISIVIVGVSIFILLKVKSSKSS